MLIELIEKQGNKYRLKIDGIECLFIPLDLFTTRFLPVKRCLSNGSLGWYVNRKFTSYKQIKNAIKTIKIPEKIHTELKVYCATNKENLIDFVGVAILEKLKIEGHKFIDKKLKY